MTYGMDDHLDEKTMKQVLDALAEMKKEAEKWQARQEAKLWTPIQVPINLNQALSRLTKDELTKIRQNLDIGNISSLNKPDLIVKLAEYIPLMAEELFLRFDHNRYQLANSIVKNGGWSSASGLKTKQLEHLRDHGLVFPGVFENKRVLAMPVEIIKEYQQLNQTSYRKIVSRNTEWVKLTHGLLHYYGTVDLSKLKKMIDKYVGQEIEFLTYAEVIDDAMRYYREITWDENGYSNYRVFDASQVIAEQHARPTIDYYPFTKEQLLTAGEPGFVERNTSYINFVNFITDDYIISREEADQIVEECVYGIQIGDMPHAIIEFLQSQLEISDLETIQAFMEHISSLMNNTRQWFLKGYSPNELWKKEQQNLNPLPSPGTNIINMKTRKKIGRNDPCPCGSGKKFKKCCGREI